VGFRDTGPVTGSAQDQGVSTVTRPHVRHSAIGTDAANIAAVAAVARESQRLVRAQVHRLWDTTKGPLA